MNQPLYRLIKRGLYYRPQGKGYTSQIDEAGIFDEEWASAEVADTHGEIKAVPIPQPEEGSSILVSNLESALCLAIGALAAVEDLRSIKSCQRAAYESNLTYLRKNGTLDIR